MANLTAYAHIETRADGRPWLIDTQIKVLEVALDRIAYHWDGDEIQRSRPFSAQREGPRASGTAAESEFLGLTNLDVVR